MTIANLPNWFHTFQKELNDDINNGAKYDCTRKPGIYVIAYKTQESTTHENADDYIFILDGEKCALNEIIKRIAEFDPVHTLYDTTLEKTGLMIDAHKPCYGEYCDCDPVEFESIDDVKNLAQNHPGEFDDLISHLCLEDDPCATYPEQLEKLKNYAQEQRINVGIDIIPVHTVQRYREDQFFLTRKSCERHIKKHAHKYYGHNHRAYAEYPYRNDEYMRLVALLASIDLEKSTIVIDKTRYDYLKDR